MDDATVRRAGNADEVRAVFDQMPVFMGSYAGPEHTVVAVNAASRQDRFAALLDG